MNIGEHISEVVALLRTEEGGSPYYMYGHRNEISARLEVMDKSAMAKTKKYPLIMLILDIPENRQDGVTKFNLHIAIATFVSGEQNAEWRLTNTIDEILEPIYTAFKQAIVDSGKFMWPGDPTEPPHNKFDRPNWGVPGNEKNERQFLNDAVDVIEMVNLELNMDSDCCNQVVTLYESTEGTVRFIGDYNLDSGIISIAAVKSGYQYRIRLSDQETQVVIDGEQLAHGSIIQAMMDAPGNDFTTGWLKIK